MNDDLTDNVTEAAEETLHMVGLASLWTLLGGLLLGVVLYATGKRGLRPIPPVHWLLGLITSRLWSCRTRMLAFCT